MLTSNVFILHKNEGCYVVNVNHYDVFDFISKINLENQLQYRLPTEKEWEFAAHGGIKSQDYKYSGSDYLDEVGWYFFNNKDYVLQQIGQKKPNELGLYDMSGNVWEMCFDSYPFHSFSQNYNVTRGGSWNANEHACGFNPVHCRHKFDPDRRIGDTGSRLVYEL